MRNFTGSGGISNRSRGEREGVFVKNAWNGKFKGKGSETSCWKKFNFLQVEEDNFQKLEILIDIWLFIIALMNKLIILLSRKTSCYN